MKSLINTPTIACKLFLLLTCVAHTASSQEISITLRPEAQAKHSIVRLQDVATVLADNDSLAQTWQQLDLTDCGEGESCQVSRELILLRARLSGLSVKQVRWRGAASSQVTVAAAAAQEAHLADAIKASVALTLRLGPDDLQIRLSGPVRWSAEVQTIMGMQPVQFDVEPLENPRPGIQTARVHLMTDDQLLETSTVSFQLAIRERIARAARAIPRGTVLTEADLDFEEILRTVPTPAWDSELALGMEAGHNLSAGQVIQERDLRKPAQRTELTVRARQPVRVVVRRGALVVTLSRAEALQGGQMGDWVRVRNLDSNREMLARVTGANSVELQ